MDKQKPRHTPGPWSIRAERYRFIHVTAAGGGIAHLDTIDGEGAANARLIAAAPDLLEALQTLDSIERGQQGWHEDARTEAWQRARAAITKATQGA